MNRMFPLATIALLALFAIAAVDRPAPRVAVVDPDRIRTDSRYVRERLAEVAAPTEKIRLQITEKKAALEGQVAAYQAQQSAMADEARKAKIAGIDKARTELNTLGAQFEQSLTAAGALEVEAMRKEIIAMIEKTAAERQLDLVVSTINVLYNAGDVDLTAEVVRRLDAAHPAQR